MMVQSGGGKVYAVLAQNEQYQLAILPSLALVSQTLMLQLRLRYRALQADAFNPMLVPKEVLVGGIERSKDTLRGTVMLNTNIALHKVGKGFPEIAASQVFNASPGFLFKHSEGWLCASDRRNDFDKDFAKLVEAQMGQYWPPKDMSSAPHLLTMYDLAFNMENMNSAPESPFKVVATQPEAPEASEADNVEKVKFGKPLDGDEADTQSGGKVKVTGAEKSPDTVS